jgi:hypothetical protein
MSETAPRAQGRKGPTIYCSSNRFQEVAGFQSKCKCPRIDKAADRLQASTRQWYKDVILPLIVAWAAKRRIPEEEATSAFEAYIVCKSCDAVLRNRLRTAWDEEAEARFHGAWVWGPASQPMLFDVCPTSRAGCASALQVSSPSFSQRRH